MINVFSILERDYVTLLLCDIHWLQIREYMSYEYKLPVVTATRMDYCSFDPFWLAYFSQVPDVAFTG
jgi:hypothetical protein